jgi:hypothetical protein
LRIIDAGTWDAAQARRTESTKQPLRRRHRPRRLLSGLLSSGVCGGPVIVLTANHVGCSRRTNTGTCNNKRLTRMEEIEARVLEALRAHLLAPDTVAAAVEAYRVERQRLAHEHADSTPAASANSVRSNAAPLRLWPQSRREQTPERLLPGFPSSRPSVAP